MNAPDISRYTTLTANSRDDVPASAAKGQGLDDVAALFPGMEVFHDLRISGTGDAQLLCGVSSLLNRERAQIVSLSLRNSNDGPTCIKCRLSGLTSKDANELVKTLLRQDDITSARVEHVILKTG